MSFKDHLGGNTPITSKVAKVNSVYEDLYDVIIQGKTLTVPLAHVNLSSLRTQFIRWRSKFDASFGLEDRVLSIIPSKDRELTHVDISLGHKRRATKIPFIIVEDSHAEKTPDKTLPTDVG